MKNISILLFCLFFQIPIFAQTEENEPSTTIPIEEYMDLLISKIELPDEIYVKANHQHIEATVFFSIYKDGSVTNVQIPNDTLELRPYIKTAVTDLPKWNPKTENGEPVVSRKGFRIEIPAKEENLLESMSRATPKGGLQKAYNRLYSQFRSEIDPSAFMYDLRFRVRFVIEKDGRLTNVKIIDANTPLYHSELIQAIKSSMSKWNPGTMNGVPMRSNLTLPIVIKSKK